MKMKLSTFFWILGAVLALSVAGTALAQTEESPELITPGVAVDQVPTSTGEVTTTQPLDALLPAAERSRFGTYEHAIVQSARIENVETGGGTLQRLRYEIEILSGEYDGQVFTYSVNLISSASQLRPDAGDKMIVFVQPNPGNPEPDLFLESYDRQPMYFWGITILFLLILIVAGLTGLKTFALIGLSIWLGVSIVLPLFLRGWSVWLAMLVTVLVISGGTLTLLYGWNKKMLSALFGILASMLFTTMIAFLFIRWAHLTGVTNQTLFQFFQDHPTIQPEGLLRIGLLFATFAIIQDIAISVASGISELKQLRSLTGFQELFRTGMQIGREHLSTMGMILPLAWVGCSIWVFVFRYQLQSEWMPFFSQDQTAQVLLLSIVGLIGIVSSIPLTAAIASSVWATTGPRRGDDAMRKAMGWKSSDEAQDTSPPPPETSAYADGMPDSQG